MKNLVLRADSRVFIPVLLLGLAVVCAVAFAPRQAFAAAPSITSIHISSNNTASSTLASSTSQVGISFTSDVAISIAATSSIRITGTGSTLASTTIVSLGGLRYGATTTLASGSNPADGPVTFLLSVADNSGTATTTKTQANIADGSLVTLDTVAPTITLVGNSSDTAYLAIPYSDPGATASDNHDGAINSSVVVTGSVNTNALGDNTLTYNVSDGAGNAATPVSRTVSVTQQVVSGGNSGGGGGGGGSGGGGGVYVPSPYLLGSGTPPATPVTTAAPASGLTETQVQSILSLLASFNADQSVINKVNASLHGQATTGTGASSSAFARDLDVGMTGDDVHALQVFLNTHGFAVSSSGPGSSGNETTMFGGLTRAALAKFQAANGISPTAGYFGPKTRSLIQSLGQ